MSALLFICGLAVLVFLFSFRTAHAAFGVSPPFLNADHLVPGAHYEQTIYLVRDDASIDLPIKAALTIDPRAQPWVSIDKGFNFIIPTDTHQFPVTITIDVPKGTGLGLYKGNLTFTGAPSQAGQVTIALGAQVVINLTVGNDIYEKYSIPLIKFLDVEEGWSPRVYVKFSNEGNVPERLDGASFELLDQYGGARLAFSQTPNGLPETPPFTVKEYTVEFPVDFHLGLGQYWGSVAFYKDSKLVASQKTIFNVLQKGSLSSPAEQFLQSLRSSWYYYAFGVFAFITIIGLIWRRRRRARKA